MSRSRIDVARQSIVDFAMARNRLGESGDGILIPIMLSAVTDEHCTLSFNGPNQITTLHATLNVP